MAFDPLVDRDCVYLDGLCDCTPLDDCKYRGKLDLKATRHRLDGKDKPMGPVKVLKSLADLKEIKDQF